MGPRLLQSSHNCSSPLTVKCHLSKWLQTCGTHPHTSQMPGEASHQAHKGSSTTDTWRIPICIHGEQVDRRRHSYCTSHSARTPWAKNTCAKLLFVNFSSAFNTIRLKKNYDPNCTTLDCIPHCNWFLDFLKNLSQYVRFGKHTSSTLLIHTGVPQGCVLSPLLCTLFTHDCCITLPTNLIVKFVDDTTVLGLINNDNKSAYRNVVQHLASWCKNHN